MKKPNLEDFGLTEEIYNQQVTKRLFFRIAFVLIAIFIGLANYFFWVWADDFLGNWVILGIILTFFGLVPFAVTYVLLDEIFAKFFYYGLNGYESAKKKYDNWFVRTQLHFWDSLSGRQFEVEVTALLNRAGYNASVTPASGDKGVDVLLSDGTVIQCKAHKSRITPAVVRELYGTLKHFNSPKGILISKNGFSKGVYEFVQDKNISLWDVNKLIDIQKGLDNQA